MGDLKFLADMNVEESFIKVIEDYKYGIKRISEIDCFMSDEEIMQLG